MREDQIKRLEKASEQLCDVFLLEADPQVWPGTNQSPDEWNPQVRGDRVWMKKNAIATGGVIAHTLNLIKHHRERNAAGFNSPRDTGNEVEEQIKQAERQAKEATERVLRKMHAKG